MLNVKNLFDNEFQLVEAKALLKEIQKEKKDILKKQELDFKFDLSKQEKQMLSSLNGLKKIFLSNYVKVEYMMDYFAFTEKDYQTKKVNERKRAAEFLFNKEEAEKAGWNYTGGEKAVLAENLKKQFEWCNKAYPNITPDLWLIELEEELLISYLKSFN